MNINTLIDGVNTFIDNINPLISNTNSFINNISFSSNNTSSSSDNINSFIIFTPIALIVKEYSIKDLLIKFFTKEDIKSN